LSLALEFKTLFEELQTRVFGDATLPALIHLPGLHGDWTLVTGFRVALKDRVRFVEITYPRSLLWSIDDYTNAIEQTLLSQGITHGWVIGESFGSQFAWELMAGNLPGTSRSQADGDKTRFKVDGIILAAGFVKHPWKHGPGLMRWLGEKTTMKQYARELKLYACYARFRHRHSPEALGSLNEFVARRTNMDRRAMWHRLALLDQYDPRPVARQTHAPVYYLAGCVDPLVPWPLVRGWLRRNCPGYRTGRTFWLSDHNVLGCSPARAADQVVKWIGGHSGKAS
jgi:pimeloyl-ACP methyl ester carboxylesterase